MERNGLTAIPTLNGGSLPYKPVITGAWYGSGRTCI
eukprot:COSAG02_NODE_4990_length_4743_cov_1.998923_1_plen_35_part_10